ncbi:polyamine ABC transporter ATP-binding protein [Rhodoplanes serenus]|nr:ABC transporter ATP-binding protein [Rhodoplanes serenus]RAI33368.1 polyamine ABC transporter ATP-binding protein [Rhodoplanes serenus]
MPPDPAPPPDPDPRPMVRFDAVTRRFADVTAVDRLSLDIREGEFFALLGPSGCGKSTLLRMLAGFERPDAGRILLAGEDIVPVPPYRRPVNMMFQSYALFPHLTVAGNIAFGLKQERLPKAEIETRVAEMLRLARLEGLGGRKPHQLSGGQRQRVALARALAKHPKVLLLDEPLAALDKKLREETQFELMELQDRLGTTFVIVTHDQEEAMTVADRIAVMNQGHVVQVGTPSEIYEQPRSRWVAGFIGDVNLIEGELVSAGPDGAVVQDRAGRRFLAEAASFPAAPGGTVALAVRPEKFRVSTTPPADATVNGLSGRVVDIGYLGDLSIYKVRLDDGTLVKASVTNIRRHAAREIDWEDAVWLSFAPEAAVVLGE